MISQLQVPMHHNSGHAALFKANAFSRCNLQLHLNMSFLCPPRSKQLCSILLLWCLLGSSSCALSWCRRWGVADPTTLVVVGAAAVLGAACRAPL